MSFSVVTRLSKWEERGKFATLPSCGYYWLTPLLIVLIQDYRTDPRIHMHRCHKPMQIGRASGAPLLGHPTSTLRLVHAWSAPLAKVVYAAVMTKLPSFVLGRVVLCAPCTVAPMRL